MDIENELNVILLDKLPVPRILPGTNRTSFYFVILFILVKLTVRFDDDDFRARSASLDHIGASFFFEACLRSLIM